MFIRTGIIIAIVTSNVIETANAVDLETSAMTKIEAQTEFFEQIAEFQKKKVALDKANGVVKKKEEPTCCTPPPGPPPFSMAYGPQIPVNPYTFQP